jgi:hypothetical protein
MGFLLFRVAVVALTAAAGYFIPPFGLDRPISAAAAGLAAFGAR